MPRFQGKPGGGRPCGAGMEAEGPCLGRVQKKKHLQARQERENGDQNNSSFREDMKKDKDNGKSGQQNLMFTLFTFVKKIFFTVQSIIHQLGRFLHIK